MQNLSALRAHIARRGNGFAFIEEADDNPAPAVVPRESAETRRVLLPANFPRPWQLSAYVFQVRRSHQVGVPVYTRRRR